MSVLLPRWRAEEWKTQRRINLSQSECKETTKPQRVQNMKPSGQDQELPLVLSSHWELSINVVVRLCVFAREGKDTWKGMWEGGTPRWWRWPRCDVSRRLNLHKAAGSFAGQRETGGARLQFPSWDSEELWFRWDERSLLTFYFSMLLWKVYIFSCFLWI